ncbi:aminopeptidase [Steroidobacter agaridevorans]|uniref:Aminopeptidase n=1 Tax=Steroidobacter agaridevorans TaxID=2695856 RepID=A0A829YD94_9GAMM|nr:aminopeptidase [Steroidobacter agaridevorans]GFE81225.1 aminopeptidase [Steroidobacter agaridevorans]
MPGTDHTPSFIARLCRIALVLAASLSAGGCYLIQAATGQMELTSKRQPIAKLLTDARTPEQLRDRLEYVSAARTFASQELGLPDNDSYRSYADVGRPYVVWNVFATDEFSVQPKRWCFPIAGCVVYRGYFKENNAKTYARRLRLRGSDTAVGGVAAYSTLGHFKDPVLNTMLGWSDVQLAATLFHELAHQVVYVPGDSEFNEAFATVVEEAGLQRWLASRGRLKDLDAWNEQRERNAQFVALLLQTRERLDALYRSDLPDDEKRDRKQYEFGVLKLQYSQLKAGQWNGYRGYDAWFGRTLNNAHLVSAATYYGCVPGLRRLLQSVDSDLPRFYEKARELAKETREARAAAVCAVADS